MSKTRKRHYRDRNATPPKQRVLRNPEHSPIILDDDRETCSNGHPWKGNTRWRWRNRGGRHGVGWERDCLMCKDVADKNRARRRGRRGTIVLVTEHGTIWTK